MIQEKDFLYRVPVKTSPITTPGGQIRNPEILVDIEGGEFMHGNILDANSTNKLINQSVDDKITEGGYVTKNLLDAETARATAKENQIKAQVDIINGDSTTEGSFRKAIADVVAAAPEDLDTLKEIADKLAGNDDLHTALNQAITEKADASALLNEVTRATGAESGLQAAIATKADATALSNYVLTTALNKQVDTLNTAISAKQDAGNYITFEKGGLNDEYCYIIAPAHYIECRTDKFDNGKYNYSHMDSQAISVHNASGKSVTIGMEGINITDGGDASNQYHLSLTSDNISSRSNSSSHSLYFQLNENGVTLEGGRDNRVLTSNGSTIDITQYAKKSEIAPLPTNIVTAYSIANNYIEFQKTLRVTSETTENIMHIGSDGIDYNTENNGFVIDNTGFHGRDNDGNIIYSLTSGGIKFAGKTDDDIPTANGTFTSITDKVSNIVDDYNFVTSQAADSRYALANTVNSMNDMVGAMNSKLSQILGKISDKQDAITVNSVDVTDIETADVEKLRAIVTNLTNALSESGLIRLVKSAE